MTLYGEGHDALWGGSEFVIKGAAFVYYEQTSLLYRPYSRSRSTAHT